jgi:hypothetical protein
MIGSIILATIVGAINHCRDSSNVAIASPWTSGAVSNMHVSRANIDLTGMPGQ